MLRLWKELHIFTLSTSLRKDSNPGSTTAETPHRTLDPYVPSKVAASNTNQAFAVDHQLDGSDREACMIFPKNDGVVRPPNTAVLLKSRNGDANSVAMDRKTFKTSDEDMLLLEPNGRGAWRLKPTLRLHLYVSDPPCGDASIYEQATAAEPPLPAQLSTCGNSRFRSATAQGEQNASTVPDLPINNRVVEEGVCSSGDCEYGTASPSHPNAQTQSSGQCYNKRYRSCRSILLDGGRKRGHGSSKETLMSTKGSPAPAADRMTFTGAKIALTVGKDTAPGDDGIGGESSEVKFRGTGDGAVMWTRGVTMPIVREREQSLGVLRIKSSRSNIYEEGRTMSMSCSDKLAKWAVLGLQVSCLDFVYSMLLHLIELACHVQYDSFDWPRPTISSR